MKKLLQILCLAVSVLISFNSIAQSEFQIHPSPGNHPGLKQVNFTIPEGYKAFYTKDGTRPSYYSSRLNDIENINGNACFSIAIYNKEGIRRDTVASFITDFKHDIAIISIVSNPANFFDSAVGLFEKGCCADTIDPYKGANFWKDWEREINVEFIDTNNEIGFSQKAGVKIFGGYSKSMPQKSLAIYARSKYGDNRFRYPIFPQLEFDKYKNFVLRNGGGDMLAAHARDVFATQLVKETGIDYQEYRPCAVYINGRYWGLYNIREKINEHFIKAHHGFDKDSLIIMRHKYERQHGLPYDYRRTLKYIEKNSLKDTSALNYVSKAIDINNYILYNILEIYTANGDAGGNIRYYKGTNPDTKWKWIFFDLDLGLNTTGKHEVKRNSVEDFTTYSSEQWPNPAWSTLIIRKILENDSLKFLYINQFCDLLNTTLDSTRAMLLADELKNEQSNEIDKHLKRWGIYRSRYDRSWQYIKDFAQQRPAYLFKYLQERFELEKDVSITINVDNSRGKLSFNTLDIQNSFKGKYFANVPLKLEVEPRFDYIFKGWKGRAETSKTLYVSVNENTVFEPIFEKRKRSTLADKILVSELNVSQGNDDSTDDFIELYNLSDEEIDLSGFLLKDNKDEHNFLFPKGSVIGAKAFVIVCENKEAYLKRYKNTENVIGDIGFGFKSGKDKIRLYDADTNRIASINLKKIEVKENDTSNLVLEHFVAREKDEMGYILERGNPNGKSLAQLMFEEEQRQQEFLMKLFFYAISSVVVLAIIIFFLIRRNRKKKRIETTT